MKGQHSKSALTNMGQPSHVKLVSITSIFLWCLSSCYQDVKMKQIINKNERVFADFVLRTGSVRSLLECSRLCVQQRGSQTLTFWSGPVTPDQECVCYAAKFSDLLYSSPAHKARCYSLEGKASIECGIPPKILESRPSSAAIGYVGDLVNYTCDTGFKKIGGGDGLRQCNISGQWELFSGSSDPVCTPVECGSPPLVTDAASSVASVGYYGDQVTYTCNLGFNQTGGNGTRFCTAAGSWVLSDDDTEPACTLVECGRPPDIQSATPSSTNIGYYGNEVTYTCNVGYDQQGGQGTRFCSASGAWTPQNTDTEPECTPVRCGTPPQVAGATASSATGYFNDLVSYTCKLDYKQTGGGRGQRRCDASGNWETNPSHPNPVCIPPCPNPDVFLDAEHIPEKEKYYDPDTITYRCTSGSSDQNGERTCNASGDWVKVQADPNCSSGDDSEGD